MSKKSVTENEKEVVEVVIEKEDGEQELTEKERKKMEKSLKKLKRKVKRSEWISKNGPTVACGICSVVSFVFGVISGAALIIANEDNDTDGDD